jgi:hypothetical protein
MKEITMKQDVVSEVTKAAPAVVGTVYTSMTLNEWVALATFIYVIIQAVILVHKHYYFVKEKRQKNVDKT